MCGCCSAGGKYQISSEGGNEPRWSPTGREIFFKNGTQVLATPVTEGATFSRGAIRPLFTTRSFAGINYTTYDVSRDGNTFIMQQPLVQNDQTVVVLLNWFDHLAHQ